MMIASTFQCMTEGYMKSTSLMILAVFVALAGDALARAADDATAQKADTAQHADDEAAIRATGAKFLEAYNARDAKKLAALWSPEAVYVDPLTGEETVGRDAIEKVFADAFSDNQDVKLATDDVTVEFVSPNVA